MLICAASLPYWVFFDRYLLPLLPAAILLPLVVFRDCRRLGALALPGVALLALWSVWWEREYLERRYECGEQ